MGVVSNYKLSFKNDKYRTKSLLERMTFPLEYYIPIYGNYCRYRRRISYYKKLIKIYKND